MSGVDETWLRQRAEALADVEPPPSSIDAASLMRRGERVRRRRRIVGSIGGGVAVAATCAAALTASSVVEGRRAPVTAPPAAVATVPPEVLTVTCTAGGIRVDRQRVLAARDGVHVRLVDASRIPDMHVDYRVVGPDEQDSPVTLLMSQPEGALDLPPGNVSFECVAGDGSRSERRVVEVADPNGWFDPTTSADAGCPQSNVGAVDVAPGTGARVVGTGATPEEAAEDLARRLGGIPLGREVEVLGGYVDADRRTALLSQWGRHTVVADLNRSGTLWKGTEAGTCG